MKKIRIKLDRICNEADHDMLCAGILLLMNNSGISHLEFIGQSKNINNTMIKYLSFTSLRSLSINITNQDELATLLGFL